MNLKIAIYNMDNAAYADLPTRQERLEQAATDISDALDLMGSRGEDNGLVRDVNGNTIGVVSIDD